MKVELTNVGRLNKEAALDLIWKNSGGISRAKIAQILTVSRATISVIVDSFIASGLVLERGAGLSRGGRRPIMLEINPNAGRVVGVDLGATHILVVVADLRGKVLAESGDGLDIVDGPETCLNCAVEMVAAALRQAGCDMADVQAIGVGVPGPVIASQGMVSSPPIMPGWDGFPIRQWLEQQWHKPVTLDNDADLGALGEWTFGAGRGESNLAYVKIGTGIGCGLLLDGQVYRGALGTAGEIGHVTVSPDGPPCKCGNYGCLEAMAGGRAIAQRAEMAVKAGQPTSLASLPAGHEITARDVALAAQVGDVISQQFLSDAGRHIGSALASLINLLNPALVLIGGGVAEAGDFILGPIQEAIQRHSLRAVLMATRIERAALGRHSVSIGAMSLALKIALQDYTRARGRRVQLPISPIPEAVLERR